MPEPRSAAVAPALAGRAVLARTGDTPAQSMLTSPPSSRALSVGLVVACALAAGLAVTACKEQTRPLPAGLAEAPRSASVPPSAPQEPQMAPAAPAPLGAADPAPLAAEEQQALPAVPPPADATVGALIGAEPRPAPRLALELAPTTKSGTPLYPEIPCDQLAPDTADKLAQRVDIELAAPVGEEAPRLELCLFNRATARPAAEANARTGRRHTFVAAFPGATKAKWTADELTFEPESLPADANVSASGWATLLATGNPDAPALAIVSGRFYDGAASEWVHTARQARVLSRKGESWAWQPLGEANVRSLDLAHIDTTCKATPEAEGCPDLLALAERWRLEADGRDDRRRDRLKGKASPSPKDEPEGDPQSEWLRKGWLAQRAGRPIEAVQAGLQVEMLCGEAVVEARQLYAEAATLRGDSLQRATPRPRSAPLCVPMADRGGPARKVAAETP